MNLTKANLAVVALASHDITRRNLQGVLVTSSGTVASNGHVLGAVGAPSQAGEEAEHGPEPTLANCVLSAESIATLAKLVNKRSQMPAVYIDTAQSNTNGSLITQVSGTPITVPKSDEPFPPWENVLPTSSPQATVHVSPEYLESVAKLLRQAGAKMATLELRGAAEPIVLRDASKGREQEATYLVMPMRA